METLTKKLNLEYKLNLRNLKNLIKIIQMIFIKH